MVKNVLCFYKQHVETTQHVVRQSRSLTEIISCLQTLSINFCLHINHVPFGPDAVTQQMNLVNQQGNKWQYGWEKCLISPPSVSQTKPRRLRVSSGKFRRCWMWVISLRTFLLAFNLWFREPVTDCGIFSLTDAQFCLISENVIGLHHSSETSWPNRSLCLVRGFCSLHEEVAHDFIIVYVR